MTAHHVPALADVISGFPTQSPLRRWELGPCSTVGLSRRETSAQTDQCCPNDGFLPTEAGWARARVFPHHEPFTQNEDPLILTNWGGVPQHMPGTRAKGSGNTGGTEGKS